jgi:hypothetical protein
MSVTVTVTTPTALQNIAPGANVTVNASATSTGGTINAWQIYIDAIQLFNTLVPSSSISQSVTIPGGTLVGHHTIGVVAFDTTSASGSTPVVVEITTGVGVAVSIAAPVAMQNVTAGNPFSVSASATSGTGQLTGWDVYFGYTLIYSTPGPTASINVSPDVPSGTTPGIYILQVKAFDSVGNSNFTNQNILVVGPDTGAPLAVVAAGNYSTPPVTASLASLLNHNVSGNPSYNASNYPWAFTGTTFIAPSVSVATNPAIEDDSLNPAAPINISKLSVRTLMPSGWAGKVISWLVDWWGLSSHPSIGVSDVASFDAQRIVADSASRGSNVILVDWYNYTSATQPSDYGIDALVPFLSTYNQTLCLAIDCQHLTINYPVAGWQAEIIASLNHFASKYFSLSNYEKTAGGRPIVLLWNVQQTIESNSASVNWATVVSSISGNPELIFYQNSGFTDPSQSSGSFPWVGTPGLPNGAISYLTSNWIPLIATKQSQMCMSTVWPKFNGTLTDPRYPGGAPGWSSGKYVDGQNGMTWIQTWAANAAAVRAGTRIDYVIIVTWDDMQEGSGIQSGILNDVVLSANLSGSSVNYSASSASGSLATVNSYNLYGTKDGITAKLLSASSSPTGAFNLSSISFPSHGSWSLYVQATGNPSISNRTSGPFSYQSSPPQSSNSVYSYITFLQAKQALALRLSDPNEFSWIDPELGLYIQEALSIWNCLTQWWPQDYSFTITPPTSSPWIFTNRAGPRVQTYTDFSVYSPILYHIIEPQIGSGGIWDGTPQFSFPDLIQAVQRKRDEVLQQTACNMGVLSPSVTPGTDRIYLPDSTLDVRRVRYTGVNGITSTLCRSDSLGFFRYSPSYRQTLGTPQRFDVLGGPPLTLTIDTLPDQSNTLEILSMQAGNTLTGNSAMPLQVPNDWAWVVKYGALSDILGKESEATDRSRAAYCMKRYIEGVTLMIEMPWILQAFINNQPVDTPSVAGKDRYSYEWQTNSSAWPGVVVSGIDMCAVCPIPAVDTGVTLTVVGNTPQPVLDTDFLQVPRDVLDVILDYAQHIAAFKMGGSDFQATMPLYENFIRYAVETCLRLRLSGIFATDLRPAVSRQDLDAPRSAQKGK